MRTFRIRYRVERGDVAQAIVVDAVDVREAEEKVARTVGRRPWSIVDVTVRCAAETEPRRDVYGQEVAGTARRCRRFSHNDLCHQHEKLDVLARQADLEAEDPPPGIGRTEPYHVRHERSLCGRRHVSDERGAR